MDFLADMFVKIKNANNAGHETALIPYSKLKFDIAKVLEANGFIAQAVRRGKKAKRFIEISFKKDANTRKIEGFRRISRASRRVYSGWREFGRYARGSKVAIVSTPAGVLPHKDAVKQKVGGEVLGVVW